MVPRVLQQPWEQLERTAPAVAQQHTLVASSSPAAQPTTISSRSLEGKHGGQLEGQLRRVDRMRRAVGQRHLHALRSTKVGRRSSVSTGECVMRMQSMSRHPHSIPRPFSQDTLPNERLASTGCPISWPALMDEKNHR